MSSDHDDSDDDGLVVDENPKSRRKKAEAQPALKLKLSSKNDFAEIHTILSDLWNILRTNG